MNVFRVFVADTDHTLLTALRAIKTDQERLRQNIDNNCSDDIRRIRLGQNRNNGNDGHLPHPDSRKLHEPIFNISLPTNTGAWPLINSGSLYRFIVCRLSTGMAFYRQSNGE